jgi:hypothetical protein
MGRFALPWYHPAMYWRLIAATIILFVRPAFAQSEWREYIYADQQFAVSLPAAPAVAAVPLRTPDGTAVNESRYSAALGAAHFQVSVFDLLSVRMKGPTAVERAAYSLRAKGEVKLDAVAEVQGNWGRDLEVVAADGSSTVAAIFFRNDRLYVLEAAAPAADFDVLSADMIRFQQSLRFIGDPRPRRFGPDPARVLQNLGSRMFGPAG